MRMKRLGSENGWGWHEGWGMEPTEGWGPARSEPGENVGRQCEISPGTNGSGPGGKLTAPSRAERCKVANFCFCDIIRILATSASGGDSTDG